MTKREYSREEWEEQVSLSLLTIFHVMRSKMGDEFLRNLLLDLEVKFDAVLERIPEEVFGPLDEMADKMMQDDEAH